MDSSAPLTALLEEEEEEGTSGLSFRLLFGAYYSYGEAYFYALFSFLSVSLVALLLRRQQRQRGNAGDGVALQGVADMREALLRHPGDKVAVVLVNPVAGSGRGLSTARDAIIPALQAVEGLHIEAFESRSALDLAELGRELGRAITESDGKRSDSSLIVALVVVAGDGGISQVINGVYETSGGCFDAWPPVLPVPCGSGNGLAISLGIKTPQDAAEIIRTRLSQPEKSVAKMDLLRVRLTRGPPSAAVARDHLAVLSVTFGSAAEYDDLTENTLRNWGPALKEIIAPLIIIWRCTKFHARLKWKALSSADLAASRKGLDAVCSRACACRAPVVSGAADGGGTTPLVRKNSSSGTAWDENLLHAKETGRSEPDLISLIIVSNVTKLADDVCADPGSHVADGVMCLTQFEWGLGRLAWAKMFLVDLPKATHRTHPSIRVDDVSEAEIDISSGQLSVDGEIQPPDTSSVSIRPEKAVLRVFH